MLSVTMLREMLDDIRRFKRDKEVNSQSYKKLSPKGETFVASSNIQVGDLIIVEKVGVYHFQTKPLIATLLQCFIRSCIAVCSGNAVTNSWVLE